MSWNFQEIEDSVQQEARYISDFQRLEAFRTKYLGRKGLLQEIYASLSSLPHDQRPLVGKNANDLRDHISVIIETKQKEIKSRQAQAPAAEVDIHPRRGRSRRAPAYPDADHR